MKILKLKIWKYTIWLFRHKPEGYLNSFHNRIVFRWDIKVTKYE